MAGYEEVNKKLYRLADDGERELLANFTATITDEIRYKGSNEEEVTLEIEGEMMDAAGVVMKLPPVQVSGKDLGSMAWVMQGWGVRACISPGGGVKDDLRMAIQLKSTPRVTIVYRATGWVETESGPTYVHAGGGINKRGQVDSIQVELPPELERYDIESPNTVVEGINATLQVAQTGPEEIGWPLLAATMAPVLGDCDFAVHITGRTGTYKSELVSLWQSHYGSDMDARHLPGSWSSTANALEAQAFMARNAVFVIDDFIPAGNSWQIRAYQQTADKIIRSQGNQAGRARLTDTSRLQGTMYPRGLIISTGEDTPEGHSVRARMLILELSPGDVTPAALTKVQRLRDAFPATMAGWIRWVAEQQPQMKERVESLRQEFVSIGHSRTPTTLARLVATAELWFEWIVHEDAISAPMAKKMLKKCRDGIVTAGTRQASYLESADPCEVFAGGIRQVFGAGLGHVRTKAGGIPRHPTMIGWVQENSMGDIPTYKSRGPCIGWVDWNVDELCLDVNVGYAMVRKAAGAEMSLTKQTLWKRLKDGGYITRSDDPRQRNTIRITAENHPRQVIALQLSKILDTAEVTPDDEE